MADREFLKSVSFPQLGYVEDVYINYNLLSSFSLPMVQSINGSFFLSQEVNIVSVTMPALVSLGGKFECDVTNLMKTLAAPKLIYVGGDLSVGDNAVLASIEFPSLNFIGGNLYIVYVEGGPQTLLSISFPQVTYIGGEVFIGDNYILQTISMPLLNMVGGNFDIENNKMAQTFDLSALRYVCSMVPTDNTNILQPNLTYKLCPKLISTGFCSNFTVIKTLVPDNGCPNI